MFKRKKKEVKIVIPEKNPPKVIKELKNFRLVVQEIELYNDVLSFVQIGWKKQLVLEERDKNAMQDPYWKIKKKDYWMGECPERYNPKFEDQELMWDILRELFLNEEV
jgi:hypothetical protein